MVRLTKLNGTSLIVNSSQIECIEEIPETKVIMMNGNYHIVRESPDEIMEKVLTYNRCLWHRKAEEIGEQESLSWNV